jgi:hypothetical protein
MGLFSYVVSPFLIGAGPGTVLIMVLATHQRLIKTWLLGLLATVATLGPWLLELARVLPTSAAVEGGTFVLATQAEHLHSSAGFGLASYVVAILATATFVGRSQDNERRGERRGLQIQAWQLRELVPRHAEPS